MPIPHCLGYNCFILSLEVSNVSPSALLIGFKIVSATLDPLYFQINFKICLWNQVMKVNITSDKSC